MKLEKFDYEIGNKKTKKEFVVLGVLCLVLIVTVALYKTFASFSSAASYNIISARVANFSRTEVLRVDISKVPQQDAVYAILYDDNTLSIDGTGYMKDFTGVDLIGELLDAYITQKVTFTAEEQAFITNNQAFMYSLFDYAGRRFLDRDNNSLEQVISAHFIDGDSNPIDADINMAKSLMTKVSSSGFDIDQIEIVNGVKNIGKNAFSLASATVSSSSRDNSVYSGVSLSKDYHCNGNTAAAFDMVTLEANLEEVGENGTLDINARNVTIGSSVTTIPNDLFAWYNGQNSIVCSTTPYSQKTANANVILTIPSGVTKIDVNAFYSYNGSNLVLPDSLVEIDEFAFANYYGNDITIPSSVTTIKSNAFRDFEGNINMTSCPDNKAFAPNANIYINNTLCEFN